METVLKFNDSKQKVYLTPDYYETDHADIDIMFEEPNESDPDNPNYVCIPLKEHEAVFLAKEILRFVEMNRKDNVRWNEDEEKKKAEIAGILYLSPETVNNHIRNIYYKLGVHEKAEFIKYVQEHNLYETDKHRHHG